LKHDVRREDRDRCPAPNAAAAINYRRWFSSRFMSDEICGQAVESLQLPKGWQSSVRNAVLNVIGIVRIAMLTGPNADTGESIP